MDPRHKRFKETKSLKKNKRNNGFSPLLLFYCLVKHTAVGYRLLQRYNSPILIFPAH